MDRSYMRVIPRDLFNEASLLKCYGRIYINLELLNLPSIEFEHDGESFDVQQDPSSGSIYIANVELTVRGKACQLSRPLNSRHAWPLYLVTGPEDDVISVFNDEDGSFSSEMLDFLRGSEQQ